MAKGTYIYEPENVINPGKDRMRFELGDTMTEGGADTAALTDEEIQAALAVHPKSWKRAKLMLLESLYRRFAYEADTKTGPLSLSLGERAKRWKEDYQALKKEVSAESISGLSIGINGTDKKPSYFYAGMHRNERAGEI